MERLAVHCSQLYQSGCVFCPSQNYGRDSQLVQPPIILIVFNVYFTNVFDFEQENNCPILYVLFQIWHDPSVIRNQESLVICIIIMLSLFKYRVIATKRNGRIVRFTDKTPSEKKPV